MGYIANPIVDDRNEFLLGSHRYKLAKPIAIQQATIFPQKTIIGDYGQDTNPVISTVSVSDLSGGIAVLRYRYQERRLLGLNRVWTSRNIDLSWPNAITLAPLVNDAGEPGALTLVIRAVNLLGGTMAVVFSGGEVYTFDGASTWSAIVDTLPAAPTDSCWFNSRIFYALGATGYSYQTAAGSAATDVSASATNPGPTTFTVYDNKIYAIDTAGTLWRSTTGNVDTWQKLATIPIQDTTLTELVVYDDANGDPTVWALTPFGPWIYDAVNDIWHQSKFQVPYYRRGGATVTNRSLGCVHKDSIIFHATNHTVYKLTMNGGTLVVQDISIDFPDGQPYDSSGPPVGLLGEAHKFVSDGKHLFCTYGASAANSTPNAAVLQYNDFGWVPIYVNTASVAATATELFVASAADHAFRLYFNTQTAFAGNTNNLGYISLSQLHQSPHIGNSGRNFAASGVFELPRFDGEYEAQQKTAIALRVMVAGASATETVTMAYRIDGSIGSYTTHGSAIVSNGESVLRFGTNNVGLAFKDIELRGTLARGGTDTNAPVILYIALDYIRLPEVRRGFQVTIDINKDFDDQTPDQQITNLWAEVEASTFSTFAYRDDVDNTKSYLVKAMRPAGEENTGRNYNGMYSLFLYEITKNNGS